MPGQEKFHLDPLSINYEGRKLFVDLGAEKLIGARKGNTLIAVEMKSGIGTSPLHDLHLAIGQYRVYLSAIRQKMPERTLYMAIPNLFYKQILIEPFGRVVFDVNSVNLLVFDDDKEEIVSWFPEIN